MEQDRKGRVKAGKKRELANVKNTLKKVGKSAVPSTLRLAATLPEHGKGKPTKRKEVVDDVSTPDLVTLISSDYYLIYLISKDPDPCHIWIFLKCLLHILSADHSVSQTDLEK